MIKQISDILPAALKDISAQDISLTDWRAAQAQKALNYLRAKFPDVDEQVFFTDYTGVVLPEVVSYREVCDAADIDAACSSCEGTCTLPAKFCARTSRPVVFIETGMYGQQCLCVRWKSGIECPYAKNDAEFEQLFRESGLTEFQRDMTFQTYKKMPGTGAAFTQAVKSAKDGSCLILAGNAGTGKNSSRNRHSTLRHEEQPQRNLPSCQ